MYVYVTPATGHLKPPPRSLCTRFIIPWFTPFDRVFRLKDHIPMAQGTSWQHICGAYEFHVPNHPTRRKSHRHPCDVSIADVAFWQLRSCFIKLHQTYVLHTNTNCIYLSYQLTENSRMSSSLFGVCACGCRRASKTHGKRRRVCMAGGGTKAAAAVLFLLTGQLCALSCCWENWL